MPNLPFLARFRHMFIVSRWQRWLFPAICIAPYIGILSWLLARGLIWIAQVLLAPLLMGGVLAWMTVALAKAEFKARLRRR